MIFQNEKTPFWSKNGHFSNFFFQAINARKMSFMIFQNGKSFFQSIKTRSSKRRENDIFPKGLTHGFCPKQPFLALSFFQALQARQMSFMIFQNEKTPFQVIKRRSWKSRKIDIFPRGLTHGVGPKVAIFRTFFLGNKRQINVFYNILERKNFFLEYKNKKFKNSKN